MASRFYLSQKQLHKAKPCVLMLIREDGVEWYEGVKPGQLFQITTGTQKAYIDLSNNKIQNLNDSVEVLDEEQEATIRQQLAGHIILEQKKLKNFDKQKKPVMGFVAYEKEFVAYPVNIIHDAQRITLWLDTIKKNFKDFVTQRLQASTKVIIVAGIIIIAGIAVYYYASGKWGAEPPPPAPNIIVQGLLFPLIKRKHHDSDR